MGKLPPNNRNPAGTPISLKASTQGNNKFTQWLAGATQVIANNGTKVYPAYHEHPIVTKALAEMPQNSIN